MEYFQLKPLFPSIIFTKYVKPQEPVIPVADNLWNIVFWLT